MTRKSNVFDASTRFTRRLRNGTGSFSKDFLRTAFEVMVKTIRNM